MSRVPGDSSREALSIGAAEGIATPPAASGTQVRGTSLRLGGRLLRSLGIALTLVGLLVSLAELLARTEFVARRLPLPARIKTSSQIDRKLDFADALVKEGPPIDCVFLGASPVNRGMDPETFAVAYQSRTGRSIHCANFGLGGAAEPTVGLVAPILVERYHPRLFILGEGVRRENVGQPLEQRLTNEPWLRWHRGEFSVEGWLIERSAAYRHLLGIERWLGSALQSLTAGTPLERVDPNELRRRERRAKQQSWTARAGSSRDDALAPTERRLTDLETLLELLGPGRVVVVGMPSSPKYLAAQRARGPGFDRQMAALAERATRSGAQFLRLETLDLPPPQAWRDGTHLTMAGAKVFSRWLGEQVGDAVRYGLISDPTGTAESSPNASGLDAARLPARPGNAPGSGSKRGWSP